MRGGADTWTGECVETKTGTVVRWAEAKSCNRKNDCASSAEKRD